MEKLNNSTAYAVFRNFEKLSQIPRCSNDEERISEFAYNFGNSLGLETVRDDFGNVIIRKPASEGYENKSPVVLQAHLDMVCEKTEESLHDFSCDPIQLNIDGDYIHANKTTLGADDGIGVALIMAVLEDKSLEHPEIEALFTTTEETGMDGAFGLSNTVLKGKNLINLDNEEDWMVFVGCAGGVTAKLNLDLEYEKVEGLTNFEVKISGLQGGHSGSMIHESRANAIKVLEESLKKVKSDISYRLVSVNGGSKHNAIPSSALATIGIKNEDVEKFKEKIAEVNSEIKALYMKRELDLELSATQVETESKYINEELASKIKRLITLFPHGVNTMDKNLGVVKSSNNLAIVSTSNEKFELITSIRSSDPEDMDELKNRISELAENEGFGINIGDGYPMWKPNFDNELLDVTKQTYKDLRGSDVEVAVIHAGLETGILSEKYPDMNMISIGPNVTGAHTPNEKLSIESTEFVFQYLKTLIKNL